MASLALATDPQLARIGGEGDTAAVLERLADTRLLAEGCVCLVDVSAVRERLGARWAGRRDQVQEHAERTLDRLLANAGWWARTGETDYVVVQPEQSPLAGQAVCLNAAREVLRFFLGEARPLDLRLHRVTGAAQGMLVCETVDREAVTQAADAAAAESSSAGAVERFSDEAGPDLGAGARIRDRDGRALWVDGRLQPLFELGRMDQIGWRIIPCVHDEQAGRALDARALDALDWSDRRSVDSIMLDRGLEQLQQAEGPAFAVSLAFSTLSSSRGRSQAVEACRHAAKGLSKRAILAIQGLEGVPPSRLTELVAQLAPHAFAVTAEVGGERRSIQALAGMNGLKGIALPMDAAPRDPAERLAWLKPRADLGRKVGPARLAWNMASMADLALARQAGLTHASLGPPDFTCDTPPNPAAGGLELAEGQPPD